MTGVRRLHGTVQRRVAPLSVDDLRAICGSYIVDGVKGRRDRALLLVGFAGALRRSEVVALDREDVTFVGEGMVITLRRSKTDQEGSGVEVAIPWGQDSSTCPVRALLAWLTASSITAGPLFRRVDRHGHVGSRRLSAQTVALVVKQYASAIGRDADGFSGHSLRAGLATAAARVGVQERVIATQTRHKSMTVLRRYIRDCDLFRTNAAASLGL